MNVTYLRLTSTKTQKRDPCIRCTRGLISSGSAAAPTPADGPTQNDSPAARIPPSKLLRTIVDTSPVAMMAFDRDRRVIFWSAGAERVFGWTAEEVLGRTFPAEAMVEAEREASMERIQRTLDGAVIAGERVHRRAKDGRLLALEIYAAALRDRDGHAIGYAGQMIDVTDRENSRAEIVRLAAEMQQTVEGVAMDTAVRRVLGTAVQRLPSDATLEQMAQTICDALTTLPGVDFTAVGAFLAPDDAVLLASRSAGRFPMRVGDHLPAHRASKLWGLARRGPWAEFWESTPEDGLWGEQLDEASLKAFAFGPIVYGGLVQGGVVIGTRNVVLAQRLVENIAAVFDFSTTPSALLGERLHAHLQKVELWNSVTDLLARKAFRPVYQPIVELASGDIVGYEALTRFESGQRPDVVFANAHRVGLGVQLELATLGSALESARALPSGRFLDLNVSPFLLADPAELRSRLRIAERPVVLEITEHDAVADYPALREAVHSLGTNVRLAVDDAGAGIANFSHIVELRADFVKLDISLVRGVNANLGRQALVVAMRHFARTAGCRLVAEGVETDDEARALTQLGVEFAQGHLFGRPKPVPLTAKRRRRPRRVR